MVPIDSINITDIISINYQAMTRADKITIYLFFGLLVLDLAGVKPGAERLKFVAADGKYNANLKLEEVKGEGMLIAYAFQDRPLAKVHGYPLRVVAKDQPGNRWVKWLGQIVVQ
jgi:hypothetical protein